MSSYGRQWIEALRGRLAELIALISFALVAKSNWKQKWERGRGALISDPVLLDKFEQIVKAEAKRWQRVKEETPDATSTTSPSGRYFIG